ncbi:23393_t:CDS:1, partial [Gigaspora rosea]
KRDVKAISKTLVETSSDAIVDLSRLSRLQRELRFLNALEKILSTTLNLEVTRLSDKVQKEHSEQYKNKEIDFLNHFLLKSVKEQLDLYNVSNIPDKQALADVIIMFSICPTEIKNLRISSGGITGYTKNRVNKTFLKYLDHLKRITSRQDNCLHGFRKQFISDS